MGGRCCHPCLENVYLHSQSSMETNVIRSWLGHVSFTTTNEYIEIDMAMKREAIERCTPPVPEPREDIPWRIRRNGGTLILVCRARC